MIATASILSTRDYLALSDAGKRAYRRALNSIRTDITDSERIVVDESPANSVRSGAKRLLEAYENGVDDLHGFPRAVFVRNRERAMEQLT